MSARTNRTVVARVTGRANSWQPTFATCFATVPARRLFPWLKSFARDAVTNRVRQRSGTPSNRVRSRSPVAKMTTTCTATGPGPCEACGRIVRWADIQTCPRRNGPAPQLWTTGCVDCAHASPPLRDAAGDVIGTKPCGCSADSVASGNVWVRCGLKNGPVMEQLGTRCVRKVMRTNG